MLREMNVVCVCVSAAALLMVMIGPALLISTIYPPHTDIYLLLVVDINCTDGKRPDFLFSLFRNAK